MTGYTFSQLIDFTRTSAATYVNSSGNIVSTPASVNLLTFTQEFDNAAWTKSNATVTANAVVAPDGTLTADKLVENTATAQHYALQGSTTLAVPYTFSVYVKAAERTFAMIYNTQTTTGQVVNLSTGALAGNAGLNAPTSSSVTDVGNGWYLVSMTFTATAASNTFRIYAMSDATTYSYTGDGTSGIYIWGAQLEAVPAANLTLGSELVTNGDFSGGATGWTLGSGWAVASGQATFTATSANAAITSVAASASAAGKTYRVEYTVVSNTLNAGGLRVGGFSGNSLFGASLTVIPSTVGVNVTYVYVAAPNGTGTVLDFWVNASATSGAITLDNISVKEITGTTGMPTTYTRNYGGLYPPRFDYDPVTLAPKGLLIEEQRTNLLTYSEQFDNAAWTKAGGAITADATTSPDGTADADKFVEDTSSGGHYVTALASVTSGTAYTISAYVKASGRSWVRIAFGSGFASTNTWFDIANGTVGTVGATSATIQNAGNGWYRITATQSATSSTSGQFFITTETSGSGTSYTGDGTSGLFLWGAQLEAGAFATSYIPTVASQVTRTADVATIQAPMFAPWYNQSEGTVVSEFSSYVPTSNSQGIWTISDWTNSERWFAFCTNNTIRHFMVDDGVTQASIDVGTYSPNTVFKSAMAIRLNSVQASINGVLGVEDTSATIPTVDRMDIGSRLNAAFLNGHIRSIRYYPVRLSNSQLQALTA